MAKYCSKECEEIGVICDFCKYYKFGVDDNGYFVGDGWCKLHKKRYDIEYGCNDFICHRIKEKK